MARRPYCSTERRGIPAHSGTPAERYGRQTRSVTRSRAVVGDVPIAVPAMGAISSGAAVSLCLVDQADAQDSRRSPGVAGGGCECGSTLSCLKASPVSATRGVDASIVEDLLSHRLTLRSDRR